MEEMPTETLCEKCGGTGWIIVERASVSGAEPCGCRSQGRAGRLEERAQIPPLYKETSFENFVVPGPENPIARRQLTNILLAVKQYVRDFPTKDHIGLLLIGGTGTGKTHLAVAALRQIMNKGFEGLFCNYQTLLNSIKRGYDAASNSSDQEAYITALKSEVLLLDDIGAQSITGWVEDTINSIVTYRCDNRKPLITTTNLPDGDVGQPKMKRSASGIVEYDTTLAERIGARARSRLLEMCTVIHMPLIEDYRIRKGKQF
jgi:DNA replication protein DnaC